MKNYLLKIIALAPILMAFQCDKDLSNDSLILNEFKVTITPNASFILSDTIWISGKTSSKAYAAATGDSIFFDQYAPSDLFSVMKLKEASQNGNSIDAIDRFELIIPIGDTDFLGLCPNAGLIPISELADSTESYEYKIGLVPLESGSYFLSWDRNSILTNTDRHTFILENFEINSSPNELIFNRCGNFSTLLNIDESDREYFFNVE